MTRLISLLIAAISVFGTIANAATAEYERDFLEKRCGGQKACESELAVPVSKPDILTFAEQFVIQKYTESNRIEDETIMLDAASKIPVSELTAYRGGSQSWAGIRSKGDVVTISRITSISADQTIAENFVKDQLLIFHTIGSQYRKVLGHRRAGASPAARSPLSSQRDLLRKNRPLLRRRRRGQRGDQSSFALSNSPNSRNSSEYQ
ncbi:MAG: hypothetical protein IPJ84_09875 [Bdellovibrionales bacterium]|nr:hypothetical protein [Bdellovibrionales bacterium]